MKLLLTILSLIPALIQALKAIEEAIPGKGKGEEKLILVRGIVETVYENASEIWPTLEKVISQIITSFNTLGVFSK